MVHNVGLMGSSTPASNAVNAAPELKPSPVNVFPRDRITFGEDEQSCCGSIFSKIGGVFSWVWETMKSVFQTIFFCCDYSSSVDGKESIKELTELRDLFVSLKGDFVSKRDSVDNHDEFKAWWKGVFDSLSEKAQSFIVKKDMEGWARNKLASTGDSPSQDQIDQYVEGSYRDSDLRSKSLQFVRDLLIADWTVGGKIYKLDPADDESLPKYLNEIAAELSRQIDNLETESE